MKAKKVLITGGAGFIGSNLAVRLHELGNEVTILDNKDQIPSNVKNKQIEIINGTVTDMNLLKTLLPKYDLIFHLAAMLGVRTTVTKPVELVENNFIGTLNVLKVALESKIKVVFASTSEVYGKGIPPFDEEMGGVYGPTTKLRWSYALSKSLEECLCLGYARKGLPITIVRYFNIYGPFAKEGPYAGVIPRFISAALLGNDIQVYGDGSQSRCFTYVTDAVEATILAGNNDQNLNQEIINIGSTNLIQIKDLALKIKKLTGSTSRIVNVPFHKAYPDGFEEIPNRIPNIDKSNKLLNYSSIVPLNKGLKETILWTKTERGI